MTQPEPIPPPKHDPRDDMLDATVRAFLNATASKTPTPGGGSVAALAGALAASLAEMALHYTIGKKQFEHHKETLEGAVEKLRKASGLMQDLVEEDMQAFKLLTDALKIPQEDRAKDPRFTAAVEKAIAAPSGVGGLALYVLEQCRELLDKTNPYLMSDLGVASALAYATVHAADLNVLVNLRLMPDRQAAEAVRRRMKELTLKADVVWHQVREHMDVNL